MASEGDAALPQAIVMAAAQPSTTTAVVVRPPKLSKDQVHALVRSAPEMFKWSSARVVKLMEFLIKDDEDMFYGFEEPTTWKAWRATVGKQAAGGNKALYKGIYLHWCKVEPDIAIDEANPRFIHSHGGDHGLAGYTTINYQERACFLSLFSSSALERERALSCSLPLTAERRDRTLNMAG